MVDCANFRPSSSPSPPLSRQAVLEYLGCVRREAGGQEKCIGVCVRSIRALTKLFPGRYVTPCACVHVGQVGRK